MIHNLPPSVELNFNPKKKELQPIAFGDQGALLKNRPLDPYKTFD
jgi:hypothetical protein